MTGALLEISGLSKSFGPRRARVQVLDDVSLALPEGGMVGIVGESGSGKSTTLRCTVGLEVPDSGRITFDGTDVASMSKAERFRFRREVQMVFQDPYASLSPRMTVAEIVSEGLVVHGLLGSKSACEARAAEVLELVGLDASVMSRFPRSFSGGQRQRIAIARALAVSPRVLLCDEPVSALDVSVQAQVINLLQDLNEKFGLAVLFVGHDLAVVRHLCKDIAVMERGRVVEHGSRESVFAQPEHAYTKSLLAAIPIPDPATDRARRDAARHERKL